MQLTEEKLIIGCIRNEYKAQKMLYKNYYNFLMGISLRYCQSRDEAEDVLLIGFYRIYKNIEKYNGKGSFENWMKRIVVNAAIDNYRKNKKYYHHDDIEALENLPDESNPMPENVPIEEIRKAVNDLSPGYRMVFNLYCFEGY
ncbi:MAG: sigma-70 family RNA polymerase sigma factor [Bacteroidales bacterium]|jgi:RNA polymerase sigma-70 factor (ECF subfamily)